MSLQNSTEDLLLKKALDRESDNEHTYSNGLTNEWVVQKFGGTSVGKFPVQIAEDVVGRYLVGNKVACVVSARSSETKSEGTTSR